MAERQPSPIESGPHFSTWGPVRQLEWERPDGRVQLLLAIVPKRKNLKKTQETDRYRHSNFIISKLNGAHPRIDAEIDDSIVLMSATDSVELFEHPDPSDSKDSEMKYLAKAKDRSVFVQIAQKDQEASTHRHNTGWERYEWIRGELGILLPQNKELTLREGQHHFLSAQTPHRAYGKSEVSSISVITTTATDHDYLPSLD
jgi:hypothetical protein